MMTKEQIMEDIRNRTVTLILAARATFLGLPGTSALTHWSRLSDRLRAATRQSSEPREWCTRFLKGLGIVTPEESLSEAIDSVVTTVRNHRLEADWMEMLDREWGYLMALARVQAQERREAREAAGLVSPRVPRKARAPKVYAPTALHEDSEQTNDVLSLF